MSRYTRAVLFFGCYVPSVDFERLVQVPELKAFTSQDLKRFSWNSAPVEHHRVYIWNLGEDGGWAISSTVPEEVGPIEKPLDAFAGDRDFLLRVARAAYPDHEVSYVGWQVALGYY